MGVEFIAGGYMRSTVLTTNFRSQGPQPSMWGPGSCRGRNSPTCLQEPDLPAYVSIAMVFI